jgi:hypothetical protein
MLVVPGVYLAARYSLVGFVVASEERKIVETFRKSAALTAGGRARLSQTQLDHGVMSAPHTACPAQFWAEI